MESKYSVVYDVDCNIVVVEYAVVLVGEFVDEYVDVVEHWMDDDYDVVVVLDVDIDVVQIWDVRMMKNTWLVH